MAWPAAGICLVLAVVDTALVAAAYPLLSTKSTGIHGWPLVNVAGLGSAALGAVVLTTHPRHPIGWILSFIGVSTSISLAAESYGIWVLQYDGPGTATQGHLAGWVAAVLGGPTALAFLTGVFLLVPSGEYLSARWRWVARGAWAGMGLYVVGSRPGRPERHQPQWGPHRRGTPRAVDAQRRRRPDHADAPGQRRGDGAAAPRSDGRGPPAAAGRHASGRPVSGSASSSSSSGRA